MSPFHETTLEKLTRQDLGERTKDVVFINIWIEVLMQIDFVLKIRSLLLPHSSLLRLVKFRNQIRVKMGKVQFDGNLSFLSSESL